MKARQRLKSLILQLLDSHRIMALATNRPDGWPQATVVGYVNDGLMLYCFVARNSQKYANILQDSRVSIAIGSDSSQPRDIKGLSLAGRASVVTDPRELARVATLRLARYPEYATQREATAADGPAARIAPEPPSSEVALLRIEPEVFSVVDYSQSFGHSDLIAFSERDLDVHVESLSHRWDESVQ